MATNKRVIAHSGEAVQKNVSQLREGQKPSKPEKLSRPASVIVPPPATAPASNKAAEKK